MADDQKREELPPLQTSSNALDLTAGQQPNENDGGASPVYHPTTTIEIKEYSFKDGVCKNQYFWFRVFILVLSITLSFVTGLYAAGQVLCLFVCFCAQIPKIKHTQNKTTKKTIYSLIGQ